MICSLLLLTVVVGQGDQIKDLPSTPDELIARQKAAFERIRTFSGTMSMVLKSVNEPPIGSLDQSFSGEYWVAPGKKRTTTKNAGQLHDSVIKEGKEDTVSSALKGDQKRPAGATRRAKSNDYGTRGDPYRQGLLVLTPPMDIRPLTIKELVERATIGQTISRKTVDGRMLVAMTLKFPPKAEDDSAKSNAHGFTMEIYFDPSVNYLVRKATYAQKNQAPWVVYEVQEFKELKPGIFFPVRAIATHFDHGTEIDHFECSMTNIQINEPIPDEIFELTYPEGETMLDSLTGTSYKINAFGDPITEPVAHAANPPAMKTLTLGEKTDSSTMEAPTSWYFYILPLSLLILGLAFALHYFRK